jgi:hypothetical protein
MNPFVNRAVAIVLGLWHYTIFLLGCLWSGSSLWCRCLSLDWSNLIMILMCTWNHWLMIFFLLWKEEGVHVWDTHTEEHFNLRALLFITINDWPTLSNLSGHSNKGYWACTHCLHETDSMYLKHYRNIVYMGHRRFLPIKHPLRKKHAHYGGKADLRTKPRHICGKMVFEMVKDID